jgi:hypothetical protein
MRILLLAVPVLMLGCGPDESGDSDVNVSWKFLEGDCTSNMVSKVKVSWTALGVAQDDVEFECSAGQGKLGQFGAMGGEYGFTAVGIDSAGVERFTHFGSSIVVGAKGTFGEPVSLTLRPKPADITVNWRMSNGGGCPGSVVLPYTITLYRPPEMAGGALTMKVKETQESCSTRTARLEDVTPGDYVVDLDSRAITPKVKANKPITVLAGQNAIVDFDL